jgi:hypothetical protein
MNSLHQEDTEGSEFPLDGGRHLPAKAFTNVLRIENARRVSGSHCYSSRLVIIAQRSTLTTKYTIVAFSYTCLPKKEVTRTLSQNINIDLSLLRVWTWNLEGIDSAKIEIGS